MQYSRTSIAGAAVGFFFILAAIIIGTRDIGGFFSLEGLMIVIGGTLAVAFMSFEANYVVEALRSIGLMFRRAETTHNNLQKDLIEIIAWARIVKERGLMGLENETGRKGIADPFVKYGIDMVVSNYSPEEVRTMMETAADAAFERSTVPVRVLTAMASHAPAFGMVGTLVGMVIMLADLGGDMSGIGAGLAISLLATLYGVVTARMIYMPAAAKLLQKEEELRFRNQLITEGLALLVANKSPRYIQDRLNSFLRFESHYDIDGLAYKEITL
ncbi:MAG: MotA/TolQ/ExbB proton channel family protein [Micavibrio sp.]